jgi:hypothetical protein
MERSGSSQHRKSEDGGDEQRASGKPIWSVSHTAIAVWCFFLGTGLIWFWVRDYVPLATQAQVFIESIFSLAIVIVIVVHAMMYYKQAKEANRQVEISGDSLIIGSRSYVGVHSIESQLKANRAISIRVENVGTVPAFNIEVRVELASLIAQHVVQKTPNVRPSIYLQHKDVYGRTQLLAGNFKPRIAIAPEKCFRKEEIDLFTQNIGVLGIRVHVKWQDGFEQGMQIADFAFVYDYDHPTDEWIPTDPDSPFFEMAKEDQRRRDERNAQKSSEEQSNPN